ncbi:hypothetical protein J4E91_000152 [Alternaria rosae]|nr:hypothetical protein J4E91_000152 [Alternaria rosae]
MSTRRQDSQHEATQGTISTEVGDSDSSINIGIVYDYAKYMDPSAIIFPMPDTKMLQVDRDGKPSIALTSYDCDSTSHTPVESRPLALLFKPISEDEIRNQNSTPASRTAEDKAALARLRAELDAHFQILQRRFEYKRGISWTPLRPWVSEAWNWSDDGSDEGEGVLDWS